MTAPDRAHTSTALDDAQDFGLTREQATDIVARVRRLTSADSHSVSLELTATNISRIANGRVLMNADSTSQGYRLGVRVGNRWGGSEFTATDDASLRAAIEYAEWNARQQPGRRPWYRMPTVRLPVPDVPIWKPSTLSAMIGDGAQTVRSTALPAMIETVANTPFVAAGVLGFTARSLFMSVSSGPEAYYRETNALCSVSARAKDGSSSGWAGAVSRDWAALDVTDVARRAVTIAERAVKPVALEPGRRTTILSATACGQLLSLMSRMFDAFDTDLGNTPFSKKGFRDGNKIGLRVVDERLRLWSDPADPMGGYIPFWGDIRDGMDTLNGAPVPAMTWIEGGVLKNLAYGHRYSLEEGKPWNRIPHSLHLDTVDGVTKSTVDEMIAKCKEGLFVNRFSSIAPVDTRSGMSTGVTRDGCFFIKDGKIKTPVKNLRFLDSPIFALNKLVAIGTPERIVDDDSFPAGAVFPIIAPPVMVMDFNFSAMSDAI